MSVDKIMSGENHHTPLLWAIVVGTFGVKAASLLSLPFLTLYLFKNTTLSITMIGIIVGLQPLAWCIGSIMGGYFSDVFKRHSIILFSVAISSLVYLGFYLTSKFLSNQPQVIAFALINMLNGITTALFSPVSRAIMTDIATDNKDNMRLLHLCYLANNTGAAVGPLVGAYAGIAANSTAFVITSVLYIAYTIILFLALRNYDSPQRVSCSMSLVSLIFTLRTLVKNSLFMSLLISATIFNIIYVQLSSNLALIIDKINIVNGTVFFSWMLSLNAILVIVLQPIIYLIIKNRNQRLIILYGYLIILIGSLFVPFLFNNRLQIILFVICLTISEILIFPTSNILVSEFTSETNRGTAYGAIDFTYIGGALGPVLCGMIIQHFSVNYFFITIFLLSLVCIFTFLPCLDYSFRVYDKRI